MKIDLLKHDPYVAIDIGGKTVKLDPFESEIDWLADWGVYKIKNKWYVMGKKGRATTYLHRQLTGAQPGEKVYFRNLDTLDLRLCNLVVTTASIEGTRTGPRGASGLKGVYWSKARGMWEAKLAHPKGVVPRNEHLGFFADKRDAARAYDRRVVEVRGALGVTNEGLGLL
jgi:hypothetical protein